MSSAHPSEFLGSGRLSVRSPREGVSRPKSAKSGFGESLDFENLELTGEPTYRSVSEGESRRIESVNDGIEALEEYIECKEDATLVLEEEESGDVRVLPYNHRWTEEYRNMLYAKLKSAGEALDRFFGDGPTPVTLLTLTGHQTDENGDARPLGAVLDDLMDGWEKFRKALSRATEGRRTEYMRIVEPHESGYPHIHVAVFGVADPTLQEKVQELWVDRYGVGGEAAHSNAVEVARGRSAQMRDVASYLMKYLGKTTVRDTGNRQQVDGYQAFSALLWVTGRRQYSASESLTDAMSRDGDGESSGSWRFVGVGAGLEPGRYQGENARRVVRSITGSVSYAPRNRPPPDALTSSSSGGRVDRWVD